MILAIVQARMSSERLHGKVMKEILGKPMIGHVFQRLSLSKEIDKIILATSDLPENNKLCDYVCKLGFDIFRGSEDDVLDRFYKAAGKYKPGGIARITGDCPLIDPEICDEVVNVYRKKGIDYVATGETFAEGLDCEVFTYKALEIAWRDARLKSEREHVTLFIRNHEELFNQVRLKADEDASEYRIVVDEPDDFFVVKSIFEELSDKKDGMFGFKDIKEFLDRNMQIRVKNSGIIRNGGLLKSLSADGTVEPG